MNPSSTRNSVLQVHPDQWSSVAFDDPVPADSGVFRELSSTSSFKTHSIERQVQRKLLAQPNLKFSSLVVRRIPRGVCLEGVLEMTDDSDLCKLARQVEGVEQVLNRLVVRGSRCGASAIT